MTRPPLPTLTIARPTMLLLLLAVLAGCDGKNNAPQSNLPTVSMNLGGKRFTLEVADSPATREKGLMQRDSMPEDHGMIFVFNREFPLSFWMSNTRIPLDIVYVDAAGKVVSVKQMKPYDRTSVRSDGDAQYAIELNAGTAERVGVKPGATLALPMGLKAKD